MLSTSLAENEPMFAELEWQDHVCMVYDAEADWISAVESFLAAGLAGGEACLCLLPGAHFDQQPGPAKDSDSAMLKAVEEGRLLYLHDTVSLRKCMQNGETFSEFLAAQGKFAAWIGCRVVCDMNWLRECGFSEKLRFVFLEWLQAGRPDPHLLVLSGYQHSRTSFLEMRHAFGVHSYVYHAGQLLPGGFRRPMAYRHARNFHIPEAGWRRTFRRGQVLEAIFEALPFAVWMLNACGEVVFVNRQVCDLLGRDEVQILDHNVQDLRQPAHGDTDAALILGDSGGCQSAGPVETEHLVRHGDGSFRDLNIIHTPVMDDDGQVQGLLGLAMDMTGCRKAEHLLKASEERFRDIAFSIGELIWEVDSNWKFRYLSDCADRVLGSAAEKLVGKSLFDIDHCASEETWQVLLNRWQQAPEPFRNVEKWLQHPDGNEQCLLLSGMPVIDKDGNFDGFRGVAEDITGRKQQEASLKKALWEAEDARDKIDNILRSISEALVVVDDVGRIVRINPRAEMLFGVNARQAVGRPFTELCPETEACSSMMQRLAKGESDVCEACFSWPEIAKNNPAFFKARASRLQNIQGESGGAIVIFQDMTREREMERVKTEFISTAAHELRTPLTSIMGYLEFCMHPEEFGGFSESQLKEFMAEIYDKAEVLERIVSDLLDISRMEAGREIPLVVESVDVVGVTRKLLQHFQLQFPRYRFEMEFAAGVVHQVRADREKLVQVMENLISNAVKYSGVGSTVRVKGLRETDVYRISVRDQGIGMTPAQIERMFERFYRAVDVNSGVRGLGLGMHIVKHIIERHGGSIQVVSAPRQGTEIIFNLPLGQ